jgi:threonine/homoserine/homoserine lactone efflux protein
MYPADDALRFAPQTGPLVAQFVLGYLLISAVPGPNMLTLGTIAALRGWRATIPACAGLAAGAGVLAATLHLALQPAMPLLDDAVGQRMAIAVTLLVTAVLLLRMPAPAAAGHAGHAGHRRHHPRLWFMVCFATSLTNPVTAGYFAVQFIGPLAADRAAAGIALVVVPLQALAWGLLVSAIFALPRFRAVLARHWRTARVTAAAGLAGLGALTLA